MKGWRPLEEKLFAIAGRLFLAPWIERRLNGRDQLGIGKRLAEIPGDPHRLRLARNLRRVLSGHQYYRNLRRLSAGMPSDGKSIDDRHRDVRNDQRGPLRIDQGQRIDAVVGHKASEANGAQNPGTCQQQ